METENDKILLYNASKSPALPCYETKADTLFRGRLCLSAYMYSVSQFDKADATADVQRQCFRRQPPWHHSSSSGYTWRRFPGLLLDTCPDGCYANNFFHETRTQNPLVLAPCCAHAQMRKYTFVQTYGHNNVQAYSFLLWLIQTQNAHLFFPKPNIRQSDGHMLTFLASNLHFCIRFKLKYDN